MNTDKTESENLTEDQSLQVIRDIIGGDFLPGNPGIVLVNNDFPIDQHADHLFDKERIALRLAQDQAPH